MTDFAPLYLRIFVSHSHKDNDFGFRLVQDLRRLIGDDSAVWYDARGGLQGGETWWDKIKEELKARPVFIVILSANALASSWVKDEIRIAWKLKNSPTGKLIIPNDYFSLLLSQGLSIKTRQQDDSEKAPQSAPPALTSATSVSANNAISPRSMSYHKILRPCLLSSLSTPILKMF